MYMLVPYRRGATKSGDRGTERWIDHNVEKISGDRPVLECHAVQSCASLQWEKARVARYAVSGDSVAPKTGSGASVKKPEGRGLKTPSVECVRILPSDRRRRQRPLMILSMFSSGDRTRNSRICRTHIMASQRRTKSRTDAACSNDGSRQSFVSFQSENA